MDQNSKGRGRGRPASDNAWASRAVEQQRTSKAGGGSKQPENPNVTTRKFVEACAEIKANVQKHVAKMGQEAADDSEESEGEGTANDSEIISSIFVGYRKAGAEATKTEQVLKDSMKTGAMVCLICISSIKKNEAIWSCSEKCYCSFHLNCIQRWAKDSIYFQSEAAADHLSPGQTVDTKKFKWCW